MRSRLRSLVKSAQRATVVGRPRHLAEYVEAGANRARWIARLGILLLSINGPLLLFEFPRRFFLWGVPWVVLAAHGLAIFAMAVFLHYGRGRVSIRRTQSLALLAGAGVIACAAVLVGLTYCASEFVLILGFSMLIVLVLVPLPVYQLVALLVVGLLLAAGFAIATGLGLGDRVDWQRLLMLFNPLCAGVIGIALNLWQLQSFRARWKAEATATRRTREIARQKGKVERLLVSALPQPVADELRRTGCFQPVVEEVCVVACDIVNFGRYCEALPATLVVEELQRFFRAFDDCCVPHGLEPLRSQGDGVLAIGGLWRGAQGSRRRPAVDALLAMLEFRNMLAPPAEVGQPRGEDSGLLWSARIGVHTGPVIMGVMEGIRLTFDVWGDTVNVAARLEQAAKPNQILVSERLLWATRGLFEHDPIREHRVKNTVISGMAEVTSIHPDYRDEDLQPNEAFWSVYRRDNYPVVVPDRTGSLERLKGKETPR